MAKNAKKSEAEDHSEALKQETDKTSAKIDDAFGKLAKKCRAKYDNAKSKIGQMKHNTRRAVLLRRFKLY
ncbi:hypothetical protein [Methylobacterium sp. NEAU K]|uniref:hypothetical protein n=1 Tax=Methylobacterium sp. NEAU K TaxID=3064946 RepID=UPI002734A5D2|nr:hypothetical protein [Methylobacterium sp. NEAU K]MDP4006627.1 hypothetical protein [Methylobacterium sp. NEAU K]